MTEWGGSPRLRVSVYITTYNRLSHLKRAVRCVLEQTREVDQLVISDDGSTDGTVAYAQDLASSDPRRILVLADGINRGIGGSRARAIEACTGDLVAGLDDDDLFEPTKIAREAELLEGQPGLIGAFSNFRWIDEHDQVIGVWERRAESEGDGRGAVPSGEIFEPVVLRRFPKDTLFRSELVRRAALIEAGGYRPGLNLYEDFDLKIRLAALGPLGYCPEVLHSYRVHQSGLSRVDAVKRLHGLRRVYELNADLLIQLEPGEEGKEERVGGSGELPMQVRRYLARAAWRGLRDARRMSVKDGRVGQSCALVREAMQLDPAGMRPKHAMRFVRGLLGV